MTKKSNNTQARQRQRQNVRRPERSSQGTPHEPVSVAWRRQANLILSGDGRKTREGLMNVAAQLVRHRRNAIAVLPQEHAPF